MAGIAGISVDSQNAITSVTAFFRDARVNAATSTMGPEEAATILGEFYQRYSTDACNGDQLLALADLSLRARDYDSARQVLNRARLIPQRAHLAYYKLGRLEMTRGDPAAAHEHFTWGAEVDPAFPFNWMGRARALHALGRRREAAEHAERFAGFGVRPHGQDELAILADLADFLFETGERARARPIYDLLSAFGHSDRKLIGRQAEALIAAGNHDAALALLRPAHQSDLLDMWGRRALAHCESLAGNHDEAIALAESVLAERPSDQGFVATLLEALVRSRDVGRWRDAVVRLDGAIGADGARELRARIALSVGDVRSAAAEFDGIELKRRTRQFHTAVETAYAALAAGELEITAAFAERLREAAPDELAPLILRTDFCLRQQLWEQAGEVLRTVPAEFADHPQILLKQFEYNCFLGNIAEAARLQERLEEGGLPGRQFALPVLRFLAEQQRWGELADRAIAWLGADFRYDQIGYVLFRAARRTGRQAEFIAAIEAIPQWRDSQDLGRLHAALAWDRADSLAEMERVAAEAAIPPSPAMRRRMEVQRQILARAAASAGRRALFFCTNGNYLCATIVALHSALKHSRPGREDVFVVIDDSDAAFADRLLAPYRERGFVVRVVPASQVVASPDGLDATYGLFTSGHLLASAAYYRIFFARHLQSLGDYGRALYLDSDVLVRRPLDELFAADLEGYPLSARVETPRPEVSRAIVLHGLQEDLYFNSGVLLFDLQNDLLTDALDWTVNAIHDDNVTLLFHDQCALNLGFRNRFLRLGKEWNFPIQETAPVASIPHGAAVLHYLDRPKPWSTAYDGECATLWFDEWREAASVIGEAAAVELFRMNTD